MIDNLLHIKYHLIAGKLEVPLTKMSVSKIGVYVDVNGQQYRWDDMDKTMTIKKFKQIIHVEFGIPMIQQLIIHGNKILWHEHRTMQQYRIHNGANIRVKLYPEWKIMKLRERGIQIIVKEASKPKSIIIKKQVSVRIDDFVSAIIIGYLRNCNLLADNVNPDILRLIYQYYHIEIDYANLPSLYQNKESRLIEYVNRKSKDRRVKSYQKARTGEMSICGEMSRTLPSSGKSIVQYHPKQRHFHPTPK